MKRTLWSIVTAAVAAVMPGMTGHSVDLAAPAPQAVHPAPEAVAVRKVDVRQQERAHDDLEDDPSATLRLVTTPPAAPGEAPAAAPTLAAPAHPDAAPLARRALGPPRARAPDRIA